MTIEFSVLLFNWIERGLQAYLSGKSPHLLSASVPAVVKNNWAGLRNSI